MFRNHLQALNPCKTQNEISDISVCIVDAMKIVRMISLLNLLPSTFETWTIAFFNYINSLPGSVCHIVFDVYPENADFTRPCKGRYDPESIGERRYISSLSQHFPATRDAMSDYLSNDQNKRELTNLMIDYVIGGSYIFNRSVYVTKDDRCTLIQNGSCFDIPDLLSNHREADPRLALHAVYASSMLPNLLDSLGTTDPNFSEISEFVIHTIYNRPKKERTLGESRAAMLFVQQNTKKGKKYRSTTQIPPDEKSLEMKTRRSNLVAYDWNNCLNGRYTPLAPCHSGWVIKDGCLFPQWYDGNNLPSDEEYDEHIMQKFHALEEDDIGNDSETSDSESDYDSEEFPLSETYTSSDDDDSDGSYD